ncbi:signal peptidase II [Nocardia sp. NPDC088792]|uniref:signal peptidase II n=1 Tax=Nocardia sp. NPDC088792 TaxID=3364332 RepID=UPI0037F1CFF5
MSGVSTDRQRDPGAEESEKSPGDSAPIGTPAAEAEHDADAAVTGRAGSESADAKSQETDETGASDESDEPGSSRRPKRLRNLLVVAAVILGLDLLTKTLVVANMTPGRPIYLIGDWARLMLTRNPGAAFSMATGMTWLLTLIAVAVVVGVIRIGRTLRSLPWAFGLGMVLGGALGNLIDRLFRAPGPLQGHVVDFVAIGWWPVFNVADSSIVCGAILLVALTVFGFEPDGSRMHRSSADDSTEEQTA